MLAFFETKEFWAALIGAAATLVAVWLAVLLGLRKLRDTEMSRLRIRCVTNLVAYRFTLRTGQDFYTVEGKTEFLVALNAIPGLFGHDLTVMRHLKEFRDEGTNGKNALLLRLIRATAVATQIPLTAVSDVDLENTFN